VNFRWQIFEQVAVTSGVLGVNGLNGFIRFAISAQPGLLLNAEDADGQTLVPPARAGVFADDPVKENQRDLRASRQRNQRSLCSA
jgi:hypothetical protein